MHPHTVKQKKKIKHKSIILKYIVTLKKKIVKILAKARINLLREYNIGKSVKLNIYTKQHFSRDSHPD